MVEDVIKNLNALKIFFSQEKEYKSQIEMVEKLIEDISKPFNIMVLGEFSTGKSTFINALIGKKSFKNGCNTNYSSYY